ncbi:microtubule-associated protein RP/EB family member 1 [Conidiobolus coronatus NRRL 28638]|uniref:Microtubule-associated protein RP/EB family member 1 n=1 Tax=Conidiobolus coronatus (strain ATCC 28846 / CBS 209.66 / NRRL 28638) TaxID=796925 RepID=A0A137NQH0_CONC2|nr:microtubule-associated protein RP/EB family member 1 [Conidiobolus coronatus NRRL 28638]|eukprot:KXN64920.1 microtubule-associated protein RP/EB family member 1 [Conidiobolus coronatus NRRL 28638]
MAESRADLLNWVNTLLELDIMKIEECGTGAAYLQILDSIYGDVPLQKVKFYPNQEYEYIQNFKILQQCFHKKGIDKEIKVPKLIKKRFQDNFEFLGWMKRFWELTTSDQHYPAAEKRRIAQAEAARSGMYSPRSGMSTPTSGNRALRSPSVGQRPPLHHLRSMSSDAMEASPLLQRAHYSVTELMKNIARVESERDFYLEKLKSVENLYQEHLQIPDDQIEVAPLLERIQTIIYSTNVRYNLILLILY